MFNHTVILQRILKSFIKSKLDSTHFFPVLPSQLIAIYIYNGTAVLVSYPDPNVRNADLSLITFGSGYETTELARKKGVHMHLILHINVFETIWRCVHVLLIAVYDCPMQLLKTCHCIPV